VVQDPIDRVKIPDSLNGNFNGLIIGTFGADLAFFETQILKQLSSATVNRVILLDQKEFAAHIATEPILKRLNRSYVASPIKSKHAHHPKFVMLVGPSSGLLHVGSGNLSIPGYSGPGECFTSYEWIENEEASAAPFASIRNLLDQLGHRGLLDVVTTRRLEDIFASSPWIQRDSKHESTVVHNQVQSLLDQLVLKVGQLPVLEVVAAAPFHDRKASALKAIIDQLEPRRFRLLVQSKRTRLDLRATTKVLDNSGVKVVITEAAAPSPYPNVMLHAKFVLVRTARQDFLLQGSANLSGVALCQFGSNANVELANLLTGKCGSFDHLLNALDLTDLSGGLSGFMVDDDWGTDEIDPDQTLGIRNCHWSYPRLSFETTEDLSGSVSIHSGGQSLKFENEPAQLAAGCFIHMYRFENLSADQLENVLRLKVHHSDGRYQVIYPYHVTSLLRLSASNYRVELLEEVGNLGELKDRDLEDLLSELDRVMVIDRRSLWRPSHPDVAVDSSPEEEESLPYEDLDWSRIGELPQIRDYQAIAQKSFLSPTELGIVLQSLTSRFRRDSSSEPLPEDDNLAVSTTEEDPEDSGDGKDTDLFLDDVLQRNEPHQRVKRLWRSFVRRFVKGLSDQMFTRSVGSSVVVPSYLIFNHLCRRLRILKYVDLDFLTKAQVTLWRFMWGDESTDGYLPTLSVEERAMALRMMVDHDDQSVTLAAISDTWKYAFHYTDDTFDLRGVFRSFLLSPYRPLVPGSFTCAAIASAGNQSDLDGLYDSLYTLAVYESKNVQKRALAIALNVSPSALRIGFDQVWRGGHKENHEFLDLGEEEFTKVDAEFAVGLWVAQEPDRAYYRIQSSSCVAFYDTDSDSGIYFDKRSGEEDNLIISAPAPEKWLILLEELYEAA